MIPENELGVIVEFSKASTIGAIEIVSISASFPDAVIKFGPDTYRVEFEFLSSNFATHKHDVRECDLIICWEHDWKDCILPVLELSNPEWRNTSFELPSEQEREIVYWKQRAITAEKQMKLQSNLINHKAPTLKGTNVKENVLELYRSNPFAKQSDIGKAVGVSPQYISQLLGEFESAQLIEKRNGHGVIVK